MTAAFDHIAKEYDQTFTHSGTGFLQRNLVWDYIKAAFPKDKKLRILELNCGTGEDAVFLGQQGHDVLATDQSGEMVTVAQAKIVAGNLQDRVKTQALDINEIAKQEFEGTFDLVFSNFGGLNCLSPEQLQQLSLHLPRLLRPNGRAILVIMSSFCLWESIYFTSRFKFGQTGRRWSNKPVEVVIEDVSIPTWYYSPKRVRKYFGRGFDLKNTLPVGFFLPPSYLEPFFSKRKKWLSLLNRWEKKATQRVWLAGLSDHYLIDLQLKA